MAALAPNILAKPDGRWQFVSLLSLAILLYHVHRGAQHDQVGFEDAQETLDTLTRKLSRRVPVDPAVLESALWSANLMDEQGQWWHPRGLTFEQFVKGMLPGMKFDRTYNTLKKIERKK